ncbi:NADPH oxidase 4 [Grus japonensis]|uniref:NADPH oxidase 4 n=1 Tax=Grus japonensis TaxID=30415 RepID=A0ABC9W6I3_GRUJA
MALSWRSWLANEGSKHLFLFFWLSLNAWFFWKTFLLYYQGLQYYYLHQMLGLGLCVSRASASVLNLNCCLVLLPMCRVLLAFLRGSQKVASRKTRRLLDKSKTFHVTCGVTICIFSVLHVAAHLVNALNFSENYNEDFLSLNAANYRGPKKTAFCYWGVLKYQTNLEEHPPGCFNPNKTLRENMTVPKAFEETFPDYTTEPFPEDLSIPEPFVQNNFMRICSEEPKFQSHFPEVCMIRRFRLYRYIRSNKPVTVTSVISHPSNVLEVRMVKDDFKARPGQAKQTQLSQPFLIGEMLQTLKHLYGPWLDSPRYVHVSLVVTSPELDCSAPGVASPVWNKGEASHPLTCWQCHLYTLKFRHLEIPVFSHDQCGS